MLKLSLLLAASIAGVQAMSAKVDDDAHAAKPASAYDAEIGKWRAERVDRLKAPGGWLSLIGLHWLKDGRNTVGAAKTNDIVLAAGPANMGTVTLDKGKLTFESDPHDGATNPVTVDGKHVKKTALKDDASGEPTVVQAGSVSFYVIDRNGKKGLRVKDTNAKARSGFTGIDYYPIDPNWRVEAKFTPFNPPHTLEIPNVIGQVDRMPVPGKVEFERDGKKYTLLPVLEEPDAKELWYIFADKTSAKETYGGGRFLYSEMPKDGKVIVDFNKAYNPPCAFSPHATCPLAPTENRLAIPVTAGEKKYRGPGAHE
jgi:uncharacterized protein (DUF1684 family)